MENIIVENKPVKQNFFPKPIESEHYVLGVNSQLTPMILMPNSHGWAPFLPLGETQGKNGIDPGSCAAGGSLNLVETVGDRKFNTGGAGSLLPPLNRTFQNDLSERFLCIISGMDGQGGWPHDVMEAMRHLGAVPEAFLPFDQTITTLAKYFSPNPMSYPLFKLAWHWHNKYDFGHHWLFTPDDPLILKQARLIEGLRYSPAGASGYAWSLHSDGKYYKDGPDIHWFTVFDFVENDYWLAFDTYPPYIKKLDWNYNFGYSKGITLDRKLGAENVSDIPEQAFLPYVIYLAKYFLKLK